MSNRNSRFVVLMILAVVVFGITISGSAVQALAAAPTFTILDMGGNNIPDVLDSSGTLYEDVDTIVGTGAGDTVAVSIDGVAATWSLTGPNAGTITVEGYSPITFSGVGNLIGGSGHDTFVFSGGTVAGTINGGLGVNTLDYSSRLTNAIVDLRYGNASLTGGVDNIQNVIGGAGNDILTGNAWDNAFTGGLGTDTITGGDGCDTLVETRDANFTLSNSSLITSGTEKDNLSGIEAARLTGGPGNNTLIAATFSGDAVLDGGEGNDILTGGSGDDVLIGGGGDDRMAGGAGDDEYRGGPGTNAITEAAGRGTDTITETCDSDFDLTETGLVWDEGTDRAGAGVPFLGNIEKVDLTGGSGDNRFDICVLAGGTVFVDGGDGSDSLFLDPHGTAVEQTAGGLSVPGVQSVSHESVEVVTVVAPVLDLPSDMTVAATSPAGAVVEFAAAADDPLYDTVPVTCDPPSGSTFPIGTTIVNCSATDGSGNTATGSFTVTVATPAGWSGFLQPINSDGSSVFKLKSTVPVKFALTGNSAGITDLVASFYYAKVSSGVAGSEAEATSTSAATSGNLFRYDSTSGEYIFNWGTKGLTTGTYQIRVDLGDGLEHVVQVSLK